MNAINEDDEADLHALVAACRHCVEVDIVLPLARALAAARRLNTLATSKAADHGIFACWANDHRSIVAAFSSDSVAVDAGSDLHRALIALTSQCDRLVADHAELQADLAAWRQLSELVEHRPLFGLWRTHAHEALDAHRRAGTLALHEQRPRHRQATADVKALIALHPAALDAYQAWEGIVARRTHSDASHEIFDTWHAYLEEVLLPAAERLRAPRGERDRLASIDEVGLVYREFTLRSRAHLKDFDETRAQLDQRREQLRDQLATLPQHLEQSTIRLFEMIQVARRADSMRRQRHAHEIGGYYSGLSWGGGLGLTFGFLSCVSDLGRNGTVGHVVLGPLIGAISGLFLAFLSGLASAKSRSSGLESDYKAALTSLRTELTRATAARDHAVSERDKAVSLFLSTSDLDHAIARVHANLVEGTRALP